MIWLGGGLDFWIFSSVARIQFTFFLVFVPQRSPKTVTDDSRLLLLRHYHPFSFFIAAFPTPAPDAFHSSMAYSFVSLPSILAPPLVVLSIFARCPGPAQLCAEHGAHLFAAAAVAVLRHVVRDGRPANRQDD
jgi:hypothetical protein